MASRADGRTRFWPPWAALAVWVFACAAISAGLVHLSPLVYPGIRTELVQLFRAAPMLAVGVVLLVFRDPNRRPHLVLGGRLTWRVVGVTTLAAVVGGVVVVVSLAARDTWLHTRTTLPEITPPMVLTIAAAIVVALCEEVAWRGWLQPELEQFWGPLTAAVAVGFTWGLWYALIRRPTFDYALAFALMAIALSIAIRALVLAIPGHNLIVGVAMHAALNIGLWVALPGRGEEPITAWAMMAAAWIVAIALWLASWFRPSRPQPPVVGGLTEEAAASELYARVSTPDGEVVDTEMVEIGDGVYEVAEDVEMVWDEDHGTWIPVEEVTGSQNPLEPDPLEPDPLEESPDQDPSGQDTPSPATPTEESRPQG